MPVIKDFSNFPRSVEDELLVEFCKQGHLQGQYFPAVKVGRSLAKQFWEERENFAIKEIDAVCVPSKSHDYDFVKAGNLGKQWVTRARQRDIRKAGFKLFDDGEPVALIEVKSEKIDYSAIGQLLVYRRLFEQDFPANKVEQLWIVANKDDQFIRLACRELGIKVWIKEQNNPDKI